MDNWKDKRFARRELPFDWRGYIVFYVKYGIRIVEVGTRASGDARINYTASQQLHDVVPNQKLTASIKPTTAAAMTDMQHGNPGQTNGVDVEGVLFEGEKLAERTVKGTPDWAGSVDTDDEACGRIGSLSGTKGQAKPRDVPAGSRE